MLNLVNQIGTKVDAITSMDKGNIRLQVSQEYQLLTPLLKNPSNDYLHHIGD
jgi:hypothetical protein